MRKCGSEITFGHFLGQAKREAILKIFSVSHDVPRVSPDCLVLA